MRTAFKRAAAGAVMAALAVAPAAAESQGLALLRARAGDAAALPAAFAPAQSTRIVIQDEGTAMERTAACLLVGAGATAGTVAYAGQGLVTALGAGAANPTVFGVLLGGALFMTYCSIGMVLTPLYVRLTRGGEIEIPAGPPLRVPSRPAVHAIGAVAPAPAAQ
jgi:stage V sporulation protein SpoVS